MKGIITWFAKNGVAANILMVLIVAVGILTLPNIKQEIFPEFSSDTIKVEVEYQGAAPEEIEEGICTRVEEAIQGLPGVKRLTSTSLEGLGTVNLELLPDADTRQTLEEVKARVDAIDTFPEDAEKPLVQEVIWRWQVITVSVSGETDEWSLRAIAEQVRDEISDLPEVSLVELANARPYEISIEVSEQALRRHGLTFGQVADAVRRSSLDLPGGSLKTSSRNILIRTKGQAYRGREFEEITIIARVDGSQLRLRDVAQVLDGFEDTDQFSRFDGKPAIPIEVFRIGEQGALDVAAAVHEYVEEARARMPDGISLTTWHDDSAVLRSRVDLLVRNGRAGLILLLAILALFLRLRLALWVAVGIPISFLGAIGLMPALDISINLISLFAFIVVLGIVVDDAIIVGENVYTHYQKGKKGVRAAVDGALEVAVPVLFAVLTTVAAFLPLLFVPGNMGKIMKVIPSIVIAALAISLIESLLVLPTHLSHGTGADTNGEPRGLSGAWVRFQNLVAGLLNYCIRSIYRPVLELCLRWRYLTLTWGIATFLATVGLVAGGRIKFVFFPPVDADNVVAYLTLTQGTPAETTDAALRHLETTAKEVLARLETVAGKTLHRHILTSVGGQPFRAAQNVRRGRTNLFRGGHLGEVNIELIPSEEREVSSTEIARLWRELSGSIPETLELTFSSSLFSTGEAINIQLSSSKMEDLREAARELKEKLHDYPGVTDITDSFRPGKEEIQLSLKKTAELLDLSLADLARQVRQGFYGEEAQRIQRGRDDVTVMVRYPASERRSIGNLENMRIRTSRGDEVPFQTVASARLGRGYASIQRADRRRIINVTADVDQNRANANEVLADVMATTLPQIMADHPGVRYSLEGEQREQRDTMNGLVRGFILALLMIYALLAIPFRSYVQPIIVMSAIPFGLVGAIWGHIFMGMDLTLLSMFGLVALTGVLVNDSLVLVDFTNRAYRSGTPLLQAIRQSGIARFRPILLTSLTTFAAVTPLLMEKSLQAKFLIPMATSLGFGVLFATFITLVLVPVGYLVLEDVRHLLLGQRPHEAPHPEDSYSPEDSYR